MLTFAGTHSTSVVRIGFLVTAGGRRGSALKFNLYFILFFYLNVVRCTSANLKILIFEIESSSLGKERKKTEFSREPTPRVKSRLKTAL